MTLLESITGPEDLKQLSADKLASPQHYLDVAKRAGKNPATSSVARKLLIAAWHILSRQEPFKPSSASASSSCFLAA